MSTKSAAAQPDLSVLNGVRCLSCFAVVVFHVHFTNGGSFFPSTEWCMRAIHDIPIAGDLFFNISFHMTTFWIISGFLCEHQLSRMKERSNLKFSSYMRFLLNRLLRLYPLYFIIGSCVYFGSLVRHPHMPCTPTMFLKSLLLIAPATDAKDCVGMGWSVSVDFHGYLAIVFLSILVPNEQARKRVWQVAYCVSILAMVWYYFSLDPNGHRHWAKYGQVGLQNKEKEKHFITNFAQLDPGKYFVQVDFEFQTAKARHKYQEQMLQLYHSSIFWHGSSTFLGSLLYINLKERNWRPNHAWLKIMGAVIFLCVTRARFWLTGIAMYACLDVLLTLEPSKGLGGQVRYFFSHPFWSYLTPYTYGIYQCHMIFMVHRFVQLARRREYDIVHGNKDPCTGYHLRFILEEAMVCFSIAWALAFILHHLLERPINHARKRWMHKEEIGEAKAHRI